MKELTRILRAAAPWIMWVACACACLLPLSCAFGDEDAVGSLFEDNKDPLFVALGMDTLGNYSIHSSLTGAMWTRNLVPVGEAGRLNFAVYGDGMFMTGGAGASRIFTCPGTASSGPGVTRGAALRIRAPCTTACMPTGDTWW